MTPAEAEVLAARTLAAIDDREQDVPVPLVVAACAADRERVASDLAGLRQHRAGPAHPDWPATCNGCGIRHAACPDAARYAAGLRRTAALYGVTP